MISEKTELALKKHHPHIHFTGDWFEEYDEPKQNTPKEKKKDG
jgi:hypothetical protein